MEEKLKAEAAEALEQAKKNVVKEKTIAIGGKEISIDLESLNDAP